MGASAAWLLWRRRKPPPSLWSTFTVSVIGGFVGSTITMPVGVMLSSSELRKVEDPAHFKKVLQASVEQRTAQRHSAAGQQHPSFPPLPNSASGSAQERSGTWGDETSMDDGELGMTNAT